MALNDKQTRFVAEYLVDLNATQAAIRAGYSKKTAAQIAEKLLRKAEIAQAVSDRQGKKLARLDLKAEDVLRQLLQITQSDLRRLFDTEGNLLPVHDLPDDVAAALASVEVVARPTGDKARPVEYVHKFRLWDKNAALNTLAKHLGLLIDRHEVGAPGDFTQMTDDELKAAAAKVAANL